MNLRKLIIIFVYLIAFLIMFELSKALGYETKDLTNLGYSTETANYMIQECNKIEGVKLKKGIGNAEHCIRLASAVGCAESSCGKQSSLNPRGFRNKRFKSQEQAFDRWIKSYKKYWIHNTPKDMYGKNNRSHYCLDEDSSGTIGWCPNGLKWSTLARNKLALNTKLNKNDKTTKSIKQGTIPKSKGKSTKKTNSDVLLNNIINSNINNNNTKPITNKKPTTTKTKGTTTTKPTTTIKSGTTTTTRSVKCKD